MFRFVTCMSKKMFEDYGQEMLQNLVTYWPEGEKYCYSEDVLPEVKGIIHKSVWEVPGAEFFIKVTGQFPVMQGIIGNKRHYTKDVHNFSKKVFSIIDAACDFQGYLFWVDADVSTHNFIPGVLLEEWMIGNFMAVMKRKTWHLCSSFVGFDCTHVFADGFFNHWFQTYMTGMVFVLPQWDDGFVLGTIIEEMEGINDLGKNISGEGPYNVFDEVFKGYATHAKGAAKTPYRYDQLIQIVKNTKPNRVIEVGTWKGVRAIEMHKANPGLKYFGFDLFEEGNDETDKIEKNVKKRKTLEDISNKLKEAGIWHKLYKGNSKETFQKYFSEYGAESADLIFIDGGHSVETIKSDLDYSKKIIKKGGFIVLDDFYTEMPEEELKKYGCQAVLDGMEYELLPIKDYVQDGGRVQMALIRC